MGKTKNRNIWIILKISISLIFLLFVLVKIGYKQIINTFLKINPLILIPTIIILLLNLILANIRLLILLRVIKPKFPFLRLFKHYLISWAISMFTPAKLGLFSIVYFLKKEKIKLGESALVFIIDRIIALVTLLIFSSFSLFILFKIKEDIVAYIIMLAIFALSLAVGSYIILSDFGKKLIKRYILKKYSKSFEGFSRAQLIISKNKKSILNNFVANVIQWSTNALQVHIVFLGFHQKIGFFHVLTIKSLLNIISFIPISLSGLGIREASAIFFFSKLGIEEKITATTFFFLLIILYLLAFAILIAYPYKNRKTKD